MRDLVAYRAEFPILEHTTYLASHTLGPMPRQAAERLADFSRMWAERGIRAWAEGWWRTPMEVGDQIGRIVGAPAGSTVMQQNVAIAEAIALSCFRPVDPARNRVVYERGNFPSVRYLYQAQPDLEVVVCEDDAEIVERIDERTLLVPISHVLFKDSLIQDVEPIVRRAHEVGAARDPRLLPVGRDRPGRRHRSRRRLRGRRLGEVAVRRPGERLALRPSRPRRAARADVRRLAGSRPPVCIRGRARVRDGCRPLPHGHAESRRAHMAGTAGYDLIEEIGVDRIRENSLRQTELLIELADAAGFEVHSTRDPSRRGGAVIVSVPEAAAVYAELEERAILCDFRPGAGIRIGPHFFTTRRRDPASLIAQIVDILETGAWQRHAGAVALH